jgi:hypothetical protein
MSQGSLWHGTPNEFLQLLVQLDASEQYETNDPGMWGLARSAHASRIILIYIRGVTDENNEIHPGDDVADDIVHYDCTLYTCSSEKVLPYATNTKYNLYETMSLLYACNHVFPLYFRNHIRWTVGSQLWL